MSRLCVAGVFACSQPSVLFTRFTVSVVDLDIFFFFPTCLLYFKLVMECSINVNWRAGAPAAISVSCMALLVNSMVRLPFNFFQKAFVKAELACWCGYPVGRMKASALPPSGARKPILSSTELQFWRMLVFSWDHVVSAVWHAQSFCWQIYSFLSLFPS